MKVAIDRLKAFEPENGYYLAFSGGKDSQAIYHLCVDAGVKFEAHFHITTVDPPELIYFIREHYPDVIFNRSSTTMWDLIVKKGMPPTRLIRYCCSHFKENGGMGRVVVTGVRWGESSKRKNSRAVLELNSYGNPSKRITLNNDNDEARRLFETCTLQGKHIVNPIVDWSESDVWEYLNGKGLPHCCLYDEGFKRIGCIGCPMAGTKGMLKEFERYPKYKQAYLRAFDKMLKAKNEKGIFPEVWTSAEATMNWWIYGQQHNSDVNQVFLFDEGVEI